MMKRIALSIIFAGAIFAMVLFILRGGQQVSNGVKNLKIKGKFTEPCYSPIKYSIGDVDEKFGISEDDFNFAIKQAEDIWENELNINLFEEYKGSENENDLTINLVFDDRQVQTMEGLALDNNFNELRQQQEKVSKTYDYLKSEYEKGVDQYTKDIEDYEERVSEYNEKVKKWNEKGGVLPKQFEKLEEEGDDLKREYDDLEKEKEKINEIVKEINVIASEEKQKIEAYNKNVETYKERFGESKEFNQGEYDGSLISIYQFRSVDDLILVLAHELGHALGIGHVDNSQAIMYYLMENQNIENISLTDEDIAALKDVCEIE